MGDEKIDFMTYVDDFHRYARPLLKGDFVNKEKNLADHDCDIGGHLGFFKGDVIHNTKIGKTPIVTLGEVN